MKKIVLFVGVALLLMGARGGGGGRAGGGARGGAGGGAGDGAARAAPRAAPRAPSQSARINKNMNRTPTMTPARPTRQAPQRQSPGPSQPVQRTARAAPTFANQARARTDIRQFTQNVRPNRIETPTNFNSSLQNQVRRNALESSQVANRVRQRYPNSNNWFNDRFFDSHSSYDFLRNNQANWWGASGWDTVATWLPWDWQSPYYYYPDYIVPGSPPASELYVQLQQEAHLTADAPPIQGVQTDSGSWLPLGVFALGVSENDIAFTNFFIQLAMNNEGDIAGTYYNAATDVAHPLAGEVNKETQQVMWTVSDKPDSAVMTTGVYNLTQEMTPVHIYFVDEEQEWLLARVQL